MFCSLLMLRRCFHNISSMHTRKIKYFFNASLAMLTCCDLLISFKRVSLSISLDREEKKNLVLHLLMDMIPSSFFARWENNQRRQKFNLSEKELNKLWWIKKNDITVVAEQWPQEIKSISDFALSQRVVAVLMILSWAVLLLFVILE